jgi:hypothetical protein
MADQWRDSRFGQFADPTFGKSLGGGQAQPSFAPSTPSAGPASTQKYFEDYFTQQWQQKPAQSWDRFTQSSIDKPEHPGGSYFDPAKGWQSWVANDKGEMGWTDKMWNDGKVHLADGGAVPYGGWRDSRFGQFADPTFGKSLASGGDQTQTPDPMANGIDYSNQPFGQDGSFNTGYWDKWALGRYNTMGNSNQMTPWGTGIELGGGKVWDAPRGDWNYYSRDENDPNKINWSKDKPDWDHQLSPWGTAIEEGGSQDQHLAGWFAEGGAVEGDEEYQEPPQQVQQAPKRVPYQENTFQQSQGVLPDEDPVAPEAPEEEDVNPGSKQAQQNVSKIMKALSFGRQQAGLPQTFFGGTQGVSFAEGGAVGEDEGVVPDPMGGGQQSPQAMAYLTGKGALDPQMVQQIEAQSQGRTPTERKYNAIESAPNEQAAFGLLQHYRKRFNAYSAFAQAAATGNEQVGKPPNLAAAAKAAMQAYENIPDGNEVMFRPTPDGQIEASFRPIIPSRPAPSGGEKPPPYGSGLPKMTGNIPTIPAPSGGEKPPPFNAGEEDDTLYAAEGGVIPGEDEEDVTGAVTPPPSPAGEEELRRLESSGLGGEFANAQRGRIAQRDAAEFPQGDGQMPMPRPRGVEPGAALASSPTLGQEAYQQDTQGIRRVLMNTAQFLGFLRNSQMDQVVEQGIDSAIKAAMSSPEDNKAPQWAQGPEYQGGPAMLQKQDETPDGMSTDLTSQRRQGAPGYEPPLRAPKPRSQGGYSGDASEYAAFSKENVDSAEARERAQNNSAEARASRMFPWASQSREREAFLYKHDQERQAQRDKIELENVKGENWNQRTQITADSRNQVAMTRAEAERYKADQRITGINTSAEHAQRRIDTAYRIKQEISQSQDANRNQRAIMDAVAKAVNVARANTPGLVRDPEDQQKFIQGILATLPMPQTQGTQPQQQAPAQQQPQQPQRPQQGQPQVPPEFMQRLQALQPGKGLQLDDGSIWALKNGVPTKVK